MKPVRIAIKIKKTFGLIRKRWNGISQTKIDFYSPKYSAAEILFWILLAAYGMFVFYDSFWMTTYIARVIVQKSWQSFISFFSWFVLFLASVMVVGSLLLLVRKAILNTLTCDPVQAPRILRLYKISKNARTIRFVFFYLLYTALIISFAVFHGTSTPKLVITDPWLQLAPFIASALNMVWVSSLMVETLMNLKLRFDERVFWSLAYLIIEKDLERLMASIELISKEIVENLHIICLYWLWRFTKRVNLWPQFQVIFLALVSGNEKEKTAAKDLLLEIMKTVDQAHKEPRSMPESYRRIYDLADSFHTRMKSLSALRDNAMFEGQPAIRGLRMRERLDEYESPIMIVLTAIGVVISLFVLLR